jgi:hypothetical protein
MNEKVLAKLFLLYQKNAKEWNLEERQLYDDGAPHQYAESKVISISLNILWTMCQMLDAIDVDIFF